MNRGAVLVGALLVTIATPATWPMALATFLVRGGIVLFFVPIVVLPTAAGLGDAIGPTLTSIAFGSVSTGQLVLAGIVGIGLILGVGLIGWLAGALEAEGVRTVALDEETTGTPFTGSRPVGGRIAARVLAVRLVANVPLAICLVWGAIRIVRLTYAELTSPVNVDAPLIWRVIAGSPEVITAIVLTWMLGQILGGIATRAMIIDGRAPGRALHVALVACARRPLVVLARFWIPTLVLAAVVVPSVLASAGAWGAAADALRDPVDPVGILVTVLVMVVLWATGLLLTSVVCAWRSAVWTVASVHDERTFGGSVGSRPGDWRTERPSAKV